METPRREWNGVKRAPAVPLEVLRRRYEGLGPIEELPGERTIRTRCYTFESMLEVGPICAEMLRHTIEHLAERGRGPGGRSCAAGSRRIAAPLPA